jgi:hypothetical protein
MRHPGCSRGAAEWLFYELLSVKRMEAHVRKKVVAAVVAMLAPLFVLVCERSFAGGDWPDGPNKEWFQKLQRPDNDKYPFRDANSRSCCGAGDVAKTRFKVESTGERYPEDRWYAWLEGQWVAIPPEKIVEEFAPDGQPYLFLLAGTVQCFVRPKGGL